MDEQLYLEEVVQPQYNKELLVIQANELVRSQQDTLTILEAKLIRLAIAQVLKNDTDLQTYTIDIIDLGKLLKLDTANIYREIDTLSDDLMKKIIRIEDKTVLDTTKKRNYIKIHWVDRVEYKNGIITFKLSSDLKKYLLGLNDLFTLYALEDALELPTTNAIRLYELLASYQNMRSRGYHNKTYNSIKINDGEIVFTIDQLKQFFNCQDKYQNKNGNFIIKVIKPNVEKINKKTLMNVSYRTQRDELNYKEIKYIIFDIHRLGEITE